MAYTPCQQARAKVQAREVFKTSNGQLFARWETPDLYVVYSYGSHWPLFVWNGSEWFENEDRHSVTTSKHRGYTHPHTATQLRSVTALRKFIVQMVSEHEKHLAATRQPLWYVRWKDYDRRKRIELIEPAYSDHIGECWERGCAYIRAVDEMGAYVAATQRKGKRDNHA